MRSEIKCWHPRISSNGMCESCGVRAAVTLPDRIAAVQEVVTAIEQEVGTAPDYRTGRGRQEPLTMADLHTLRPASEWHEDYGAVLWWWLPITCPPVVEMNPDDQGYPTPPTHWSPLPDCNLMVATDGAEVGE